MRAPDRAIIVVTHYQRLLDYIVPDYVHVLSDGRIVKSGGKELALELEAEGLRLDRRDRRAAGGSTDRDDAGSGKDFSRWLAALETAAAGRPALAAGSARPRRGAVRRARVPDGARRGLAVHQRRADRRDRVHAGRRRCSRRGRAELDGFAYTDGAGTASSIVNGRFVADAVAAARTCRQGVRAGSLAAAVTRARRRRPALLRPARRFHEPQLRPR